MLQFSFSRAAFILRKVFSVKEVYPPGRVNFSQREKKSWPLRPKQELRVALAHVLIVLSCPSWPGWANQSVYYYAEKFLRPGGWIYHGKKVNERPSQGSPFTSSQVFVSHDMSTVCQVFVRKCTKSWPTPGSSSSLVNLLSGTSLLHINEASDWSFSFSHWRFAVM